MKWVLIFSLFVIGMLCVCVCLRTLDLYFLFCQVFIFGSFTEDETSSWIQSQSCVNHGKLADNVNVQFGSLNFTDGKSLGSSVDGELKEPSGSSTESIHLESLDLAKNDTELETTPRKKSFSPQVSGVPRENGNNYNPDKISSCTNGVTETKIDHTDLPSLCISKGQNNSLNQFSRLVAEDSKQNGSIDDLKETVLKENFRSASNDSVTSSTKLLPRGLINSGNLCFLNSTLQALLSCPPFVALLRNLRNREIPKVIFLPIIFCLCYRDINTKQIDLESFMVNL